MIMLQLAKNALQTERVFLLLRGENRPIPTYKNKLSGPSISPNIAKLDFNRKAKRLHIENATRLFYNEVEVKFKLDA